MAKCAKCGAELQENAKFCMECGEKVTKKKFCSQCGTELPNEAKFCSACGAKTTAETPSVSNDSEREPSSRSGLFGNFFGNVKTSLENSFEHSQTEAEDDEAEFSDDDDTSFDENTVEEESVYSGKHVFGIKRYRERFERIKPHMNVLTIGHAESGKTTLASAITKCCNVRYGDNYVDYDEIDNAPLQRAHGVSINASHIEYQSDKYHFAHIDCPAHRDICNILNENSVIDGCILVATATDSVTPQTRKHLRLAKEAGIEKVVVFLNTTDMDDDPDLIEIVKEEIRDALTKYGFSIDTPIIQGSALEELNEWNENIPSYQKKNKIRELLSAMDAWFDEPVRAGDKPFLMQIEDVFASPHGIIVATGRIKHGQINMSDTVEIVMRDGGNFSTTVVGMEIFNKLIDSAIAGDDVGILLRGMTKRDLECAEFLAAPPTW